MVLGKQSQTDANFVLKLKGLIPNLIFLILKINNFFFVLEWVDNGFFRIARIVEKSSLLSTSTEIVAKLAYICILHTLLNQTDSCVSHRMFSRYLLKSSIRKKNV